MEYEVSEVEQPISKKESGGIGVIFGGVLVSFGIGFASLWGNIVVYMTSYMRSKPSNKNLTL